MFFINLLISSHARCLVHPIPRKTYDPPGCPVAEVSGLPMSRFYSQHFLRRMSMMRPCWFGQLDVRRVLGGEEIPELIPCRG